MTFRAGIFGVMTLRFTASSLLADEVLYCTDTAATGFKWDKNAIAAPADFVLERFTVAVKSDIYRVVTPTAPPSSSMGLDCTRPLSHAMPDRIVCEGGDAAEPWIFFRDTYTRAFLAGPPAGGGDKNIWIAYGTCTKF